MAKHFEETRYWCEYCRIFVYNNRINREKHDSSPQHQANFKKRVDNIRKEEKELSKLLPKVDAPVSAKSGSFYNVAVAKKPEVVTTPVTNLLNVKSSAKAVKKPVLGLSTSLAVNPQAVTSEANQSVTEYSESHFSVDIKASSSDFKRKIVEDEISLLSSKGATVEPDCDVDVDVSALFKKKKTFSNK